MAAKTGQFYFNQMINNKIRIFLWNVWNTKRETMNHLLEIYWYIFIHGLCINLCMFFVPYFLKKLKMNALKTDLWLNTFILFKPQSTPGKILLKIGSLVCTLLNNNNLAMATIKCQSKITLQLIPMNAYSCVPFSVNF